jgi:hypothetical protein
VLQLAYKPSGVEMAPFRPVIVRYIVSHFKFIDPHGLPPTRLLLQIISRCTESVTSYMILSCFLAIDRTIRQRTKDLTDGDKSGVDFPFVSAVVGPTAVRTCVRADLLQTRTTPGPRHGAVRQTTHDQRWQQTAEQPYTASGDVAESMQRRYITHIAVSRLSILSDHTSSLKHFDGRIAAAVIRNFVPKPTYIHPMSFV